jgi:outer membrane protein assembly factor BamB
MDRRASFIWLCRSVFLAGIAGGLVACGAASTKRASLAAIDARTGAVLWRIKTDANVLGRPIESSRTVRVLGGFSIPGECDETWHWIVLDRLTGRPVKRAHHFKLPPLQTQPFSFSSVVLPDGTQVKSVTPNRLIGLSSSGRVLWRIRLRRGGTLPRGRGYNPGAIPMLAGARIVLAFPNSDGYDPKESVDPTLSLVALEPRTGRVLWRRSIKTETARPYDIAYPAFGPRSVYLFRSRDQLEALDAQTGTVRWRVHVAEGAVTPAPSRVIVGGPGRVTALSQAGTILWSTSVPTGTGLEPSTLVRNRVYVRSQGYNDSGCGD